MSSRRRATFSRACLLVVLLASGSCVPAESAPDVAPAPATRDPDIRIGVVLNVRHVTIGGGSPLEVDDPAEGALHTIGAGATADVGAYHQSVVMSGEGPTITRNALMISPLDSGAPVRVNGREYRGTLELRASDSGVSVINHVSLEQYLIGVVGSEMGHRAPGEEEALKSQAVVSRTYAIRNQGRWKDRGYDLVGTVNDQVYAGQANENPMAAAAVLATRGEVVTWNNEPIDAFFSSTCGGHTEDGTAAFAGADRPYLRSVDDHDPATGRPWCGGSPRLDWTAEWSGAELAQTLRRTLAAEGLPGARAADLTGIQLVGRTATHRVASIMLVGRGGRTAVSGQAIRRVLATPDGGILRSTDFAIRVGHAGSRIERVTIDGHGNGHAVGMCQWGAIGRSRAGQDYHTILLSYFPGTDIQRLY